MVAGRRAAIDELKAALPRNKKASVGLLCAAAARCVRTTEIGKASFLMALDGGRAATRAIGRAQRDAGRLDEIDDAFYLTIEELLAPLPDGVMELVRFRRHRRDEHRRSNCRSPSPVSRSPRCGTTISAARRATC